MAETTPEKKTAAGSHRLTGWLLLLLLILTLSSLLTYDWRDIDWMQSPANFPLANLFGPVGAWTAFFGYHLLGLGVWLAPVWLAVASWVLIARRGDGELGCRAGWSALFLLSFCALIQLFGGVLSGTLESLNLAPNAGGAIGNWLMTCALEKWMSAAGGGILAAAILVFSGVMAVGPARLASAFRRAAAFWREWHGRRAERARERQATREQEEQVRLEQEERKAAERGFTGVSRAVDRSLRNAERDPRASAARPAESAAARKSDPSPAAPVRPPERAPARAPDPAPLRPQEPPAPPPAAPAAAAVRSAGAEGYRLPGIDLLDPIPSGEAVHGDTAQMARTLVETLEQFNVAVEVTHVERGPVVTRYELLPAPGIRVERIAQLAHTLQMVLKATSLRIQAPVPGKNVVGIEVPNVVARKVTLHEVLQGTAWTANKMEIPLALGKDVGGVDLVFDLASAPHLLVAGATGSGKSVCLNAILAGLLMSRRPDALKLLLVDPKRVEFPHYNNLPHLLVPVVTDAKKVAFALRWAIVEMDRRYKMLQAAKVRNIVGFNTRGQVCQAELPLDVSGGGSSDSALPATLPYIVIVIDEVSDLMITVGQEIEQSITRLAQLSRAVGIHLILATQRPSVNVITGTIKANFPGRIAFQVAQKTDSRTILDQQGAENLIGRGDMLFLNPKNGRLIRSQGALVNDGEIGRIVDFVKGQVGPAFDTQLATRLDKVQESVADEDAGSEEGAAGANGAGDNEDGADEDLIQQSIQVIRDTRRASTSSLQRRLRIGYTRAARVMDMLEERGIVGPTRGAEPREILIDLDAEMPGNEPPDAAGGVEAGEPHAKS